MNEKALMIKRKYKQGGFTITELMLVLGVGALIMSGAYLGYKSVSEDATNQQLITSSVQLISSTKSKWQGFGSYSGLNNTSVVAATLVPKTFIVDTATGAISHGYGGNVTLEAKDKDGNDTTSNFRAVFTSIPKKLCSDLATALDGVAYEIVIGTTTVKTSTSPISGPTTLSACNSATVSSLSFYVR